MSSDTTAPLTTDGVAKLLERADILLTRGRGPTGWLIRYATRSHWNHVALVFVLSDEASGHALGYQRTFVIEAEAHGVDIHPIDKYLYNESQDMVVLRLPDDVVPAETRTDFLRRVRGFALEEIDAGYGFSEIGGVIRRLFGAIGRPFAFLAATGSLIFRTAGVSKVVNRWICSGIVQYAYYRSTLGADTTSGSAWHEYFTDNHHRARLVFNSDVRNEVVSGLSLGQSVARLRLTTPAHFALAATYGSLGVVAERVGGHWRTQLTRS